MSESVWTGPPKWNGVERPVDLKGLVFPFDPTFGPLLVLLNGCEDFFIPMFSKVEDLRSYISYMEENLFRHKLDYIIKQVDDPAEFFASLYGITVEHRRVRLMLDPQIISKDHTKWLEIIKDGDQWMFSQPEEK